MSSKIISRDLNPSESKRMIRTKSASAVAAPKPASAERRRSPGRTRSDTARVAILSAALKLLETQTVQQITIEAIAKEAKVGKATIYRWWSSKASVVIDAFVQNHIVHTPMPQGVSCREALDKHLHLVVEQYSGWPGRLVAQILAEGQSNPEELREFRESFWYGRRAAVMEVIDEGRRRGEFRTDISAILQAEMIYAPIYQRLLIGHSPLDEEFADALAHAMWVVMAPPGNPESDAASSAKMDKARKASKGTAAGRKRSG